MAEPIGLALGFTGLVGLFTSCVDTFKFVQIYRRRKDDFDIFQTMLDNQQFHFMAWGQACGFMGVEQSGLRNRFDDPLSQICNTQIAQTMNAVRSLLADGNQLKAKYGLKVERRLGLGLLRDADMPESNIPSAFERVFQGTARFWNTSLQRKSYIKDTILWTIGDKDKFEDLVDNLRNLIADLAQLTEPYGVSQSQTWIVKYEMEKIEDESSLEVITQVNSSAPDDDLVSVAASRQLAFVRERSVVAGQTNENSWGGLIQPNDSVSLFNQPTMPQIQELEEELNIGPQPIEITRVLPSQWRNVKTRQGLFPWLGVLIVCTNTATSRPVGSAGTANQPDRKDPLDYIRRAISFDQYEDEVREVAGSVISPSRVAINSKTLLAILGKITGTRIPESNNVMVHPFKYIVLHADKIRKVYQSVCQECEANGSQELTEQATNTMIRHGSPTPNETEEHAETVVEPQSDEDLLSNIDRVRAELRCLIEFMDTDLATLFQINKGLWDGKTTKVAFENLWLYFEPKGIVLSTHVGRIDCDTTQGYLVLHVSGGRPILDKSGAEANSTPDTLSQSAMPGDICSDEYFNSSTSLTPLILDCLFLDCDGRAIGPRPKRIVIPPYTGLRDVLHLPACYPDPREAKAVAARGQLFFNAVIPRDDQVRHFTFSGASNAELEPGHRETCRYCSRAVAREQVDGAVIVDPAAAIQNQRSQSCTFDVQFGLGVVARPTPHDPRECFDPLDRDGNATGRRFTDVFDDSVLELQRRAFVKRWVRWLWTLEKLRDEPARPENIPPTLLPPNVLAFSLSQRKWYSLPVTKLSPISTDNPHSIWDDLILPPGHKDLVLALVSSLGRPTYERPPPTSDPHRTQYESVSAISHSQRRSLTVLMHGAPGTGKTHLVEGVADHLRRPLFMINCAELGTVERGATTKLDHWFGLAKRWGCVLLLKEVDAFLARRTRSDEVDRVEITSVLLRLLQNFSGVAFLSTNRVGAFDSGFLSHINTSLYFPMLTKDQKMNVWGTFQRRAEADFNFELYLLKDYSSSLFENTTEMNGREIRNMWQTAMSLALFEHQRLLKEYGLFKDHELAIASKPRLEIRHFQKVEQSAAEFRSYLTAAMGVSDSNMNSSTHGRRDENLGVSRSDTRPSPPAVRPSGLHGYEEPSAG